MSRYAIISDIHGNVHALRAVLSAMPELDVREVICLGDVVGYGPAPDVCLDMVIRYCSIMVQGNHDQAVIDLRRAVDFNGAARQAIHWTHERLGPLHLDALNRMRTIVHVSDELMCVHDCPAPGPTDYVHDRAMAAIAFSGVDRSICLIGHTHVPMVWVAPTATAADPVEPADVDALVPRDNEPIELEPGRRYLCNPGSVGQPRDADPRASFAVLDLVQRTFTLHRRDYDISAAQAETLRAGLPPILADRLAVGA